jgi:hypothetical protein
MEKLLHRKAFIACLSILIVSAAGPLGATDFLYTWDPSPDEGLNGYRIYQAAGEATYELLAQVDAADLEDPAHPGFWITGLQSGVYRFAAAAVKTSGEESALANQTCITVNDQVVECQDNDQSGAVVFISCFISALDR